MSATRIRSTKQLVALSILDNVEGSDANNKGPNMPSSYVIGDHFESFIKEQIQQGRYASASEVVRDGLRALEDREKLRAVKLEALRKEIQRGAESGAGIPAKAVFKSVRKRIAQSGASGSGRR
jgi:antitoxin ParD1/3/4